VQRPDAIGGIFSWGTTPTGISDSGAIAGTSNTPEFGTSGFLFEGGTFTNLSYPGSRNTYVYGISSGGTVIGDFSNGESHGFLWSGGTFSLLDVPVEFPSGTDFERVSYFSVNASGTIVGGQEWNKDGQSYARLFLWDGATIRYLPPLGDAIIYFPRINDYGTVVGSYYDPSGSAHGFMYRDGSTTVLDVPGALATYVTGINNGGQLTGMYYAADGDWHAFVGTAVPEPASVVIAFGGLVALAIARRIRRHSVG
jgi:probable HAF family extracellular repeat protein